MSLYTLNRSFTSVLFAMTSWLLKSMNYYIECLRLGSAKQNFLRNWPAKSPRSWRHVEFVLLGNWFGSNARYEQSTIFGAMPPVFSSPSFPLSNSPPFPN